MQLPTHLNLETSLLRLEGKNDPVMLYELLEKKEIAGSLTPYKAVALANDLLRYEKSTIDFEGKTRQMTVIAWGDDSDLA